MRNRSICFALVCAIWLSGFPGQSTAVTQAVQMAGALGAFLKLEVTAEIVHSFRCPQVVALCQAIAEKDLPSVRASIAAGADLNAVGRAGISPLMIAWFCYDEPIFDLLLASGANPNLPITDQRSIDEFFLHQSTVTTLAATSDRDDCFDKIMIHGGNPNTAVLHMAGPLSQSLHGISPNQLHRVERLLQHGADVNALNWQGLSPVLEAVSTAHRFDIASLLIDYGADIYHRDRTDRWRLVHYTLHAGNRGIPLSESQQQQRRELLLKLQQMGESLEYAEYELYWGTLNVYYWPPFPPLVAEAMGVPVPKRFLKIPVPEQASERYDFRRVQRIYQPGEVFSASDQGDPRHVPLP